jgi:hypothetical protein
VTNLLESDIATRRPVWSALSELFLDTSLDSSDYERLAARLARSPYSLEELDRILLWEVYPACRSNLVSIAGEGMGFDGQWLESRILRGPSALGKAWAGTVGRLGLHSSIAWRRIKRRTEAQREAAERRAGH